METDDLRTEEVATSVERTLELDAPVDDVWDAVCDPTGWLADSGWLDVRVGGEGRLTDDGVDREVRVDAVDDVDDGHRLAYRWWTRDEGPLGGSRVEITVLSGDNTTRVLIRESRSSPFPQGFCVADRHTRVSIGNTKPGDVAARWEVRAACLATLASRATMFVAG